MRRTSLLHLGSALVLALMLGGCTKGGQFDPTEIFNNDAFQTKTKMKGDRELVFPNGVPGATTGVPPDLVKGYQPPPDQPEDAGLPPAPPSATKTAAAKPKPKPKPKVAAAPGQQPQQKQDPVWGQVPAKGGAARIDVGGGGGANQGANTMSAQPGQAPWPSAPPAQNSQTAWPAPPATTTTR